jgi:hypothetical protein
MFRVDMHKKCTVLWEKKEKGEGQSSGQTEVTTGGLNGGANKGSEGTSEGSEGSHEDDAGMCTGPMFDFGVGDPKPPCFVEVGAYHPFFFLKMFRGQRQWRGGR